MRKSIITVTGPTSPVYDLTTVDTVNAILGIESNTANDAATAAQITFASKTIADLCGRQFATLDVSEQFRLNFPSFLPMPYRFHWTGPASSLKLTQWPVIEIDSVTCDNVIVDPTFYEFDPEAGLLYYLNGNWWGNIIAVYSGGYDLPDNGPPLLAQACIEMVAAKRRAALMEERDPSLREVQHGDTRTMFFDYATSKGSVGPVPQIVLDMIQQYIEPAV